MSETACIRCGKEIEKGRARFVEKDGDSHYKCYLDWAKSDPIYQKELVNYLALGAKADYWMANPADFPDTEEVFNEQTRKLRESVGL